MKTKHSIISTLLAGTLLALSGSASAAVIWTWNGTIADWAGTPAIPINTLSLTVPAIAVGPGSIVDYNPGPTLGGGTYAGIGDGNMAFTFISQSITGTPAAGNHVVMSEDQTGPVDAYSVGYDLLGFSIPVGSTFIYSISTLKATESLVNIALDSIITAGQSGLVTKHVYDSLANAQLNDGVTGLLTPVLTSTNGARDPLAGYYTFAPQSTIWIVDTIVSGSVVNVFNETRIPVPATLALFGIGLLGLFGFSRKSGSSSGMKYC